MHVREVQQYLNREPFVPFVIRMIDGTVNNVDSPGMLAVLPAARVIFIAEGREQGAYRSVNATRIESIAVDLEPPPTNGSADHP